MVLAVLYTVALAVFTPVEPTPSVHAFDLGHHYDIARSGLFMNELSDADSKSAPIHSSDAADIVAAMVWMADWNGQGARMMVSARKGHALLGESKYFRITKLAQCELLHFDNLLTNKMVLQYSRQFLLNQKSVVRKILKDHQKIQYDTMYDTSVASPVRQPEFQLLALLGLILHATGQFALGQIEMN